MDEYVGDRKTTLGISRSELAEWLVKDTHVGWREAHGFKCDKVEGLSWKRIINQA